MLLLQNVALFPYESHLQIASLNAGNDEVLKQSYGFI
jgi:hypothetical protein